MKCTLFIGTFLSFLLVSMQENLKCLVCKQVMNEVVSSVLQEDPLKTIQVGSFRIQPDGTQNQKQIKYAGSELHLGEVLENVCNSLNDFAQAKHRETGELTLLNLSKDIGKLSVYELVPDPELNRGIKYYCESFVEDQEDDIISILKKASDISNDESVVKFCSQFTDYCASKSHSEL